MIDKLHLQNFTCFVDNQFEFCKGINVFIGENGTGKTHLLKVLGSFVLPIRIFSKEQGFLLYYFLEQVFQTGFNAGFNAGFKQSPLILLNNKNTKNGWQFSVIASNGYSFTFNRMLRNQLTHHSPVTVIDVNEEIYKRKLRIEKAC